MAERGLDKAQEWSANTAYHRAAGFLVRIARVSALRDSMLLLVLAAVWTFFYFATGGTFLTQRNLVLLALQTSIVSLAAISAVMLIVTRNFDLSVGSAVALVGVILAVLTVKHDVNPAIGVIAAICGGLLMGAWQGFWVTRIGVSSFIVTLAGMLYFRGISMIATNGATVAPLPKSLTGLATGFLPPLASTIAIVLVFAAYSALRLMELRRARMLGVSDSFEADAARALVPPAFATAAALWIASSWSPFGLSRPSSSCAARATAPSSMPSAEIRRPPASPASISSAQSSAISLSQASPTGSPGSR
jgi:ABC-type xylose transport system permease subunit